LKKNYSAANPRGRWGFSGPNEPHYSSACYVVTARDLGEYISLPCTGRLDAGRAGWLRGGRVPASRHVTSGRHVVWVESCISARDTAPRTLTSLKREESIATSRSTVHSTSLWFEYLLKSTRFESIRADSVFVKKIGLSIQQLSSNFYCLIFIVDSADNKLIIVVHVKCKCNHVNAMSNKHHKNSYVLDYVSCCPLND